ncbi:hypothetical protein Tco_0415918 [Tanacetum coccineum]
MVAPPGIHQRLRFLFGPGHQFSLGPSIELLSPRMVDSPIRTTRCSEAYMRWRSAPLSTLYPPTTSKSSQIHLLRGHWIHLHLLLDHLPLALADLSPRKRFRDSYSSEVSGEEHMEMGTADAETIADLGISDRVRASTEDGIDLGVEVDTSDIREDEEEFVQLRPVRGRHSYPLATGNIYELTGGDAPDLEGTLYDMSHYMSEVPLDRITEFETTQRQLESGHLKASRERELRRVSSGYVGIVENLGDELRRLESLVERCFGFHRRTMTITHFGMTPETIEELVNRRVEEANLTVKNNDLAAYTQIFQELTMLCTKMVPEEEDRVEKFIRGLPNNIQRNVIAAEPTRLQDDVRIANNLMDQKLKDDWSEEWDASNPKFHALFILEDGASVARIQGVKGCTIIAIIYDLGVTEGEVRRTRKIVRRTCGPKHAVTQPTRVISTTTHHHPAAAADTVVSEVGTADNTSHTVVEHT